MLTIPLLGTINLSIRLAPSFLQYAPTNPNLGYPVFSAKLLKETLFPGDYSAGYFGLTSIYTSINPWNGAGNIVNNGLPTNFPVQLAGSSINTFGVFDYDGTLANPATFNPVITTGGSGYGTAQYWGSMNSNTFFMRCGGGNSFMQWFGVNFLALNFINTTSPIAITSRNQLPPNSRGNNTNVGEGAIIEDFAFLYNYPAWRTEFGSNPNINPLLNAGTDDTLLMYTTAVGMAEIMSMNSFNKWVTASNPANGNTLTTISNGMSTDTTKIVLGSGPGWQGSLFSTNIIIPVGTLPIFNPTALSDPTDNALVTTLASSGLSLVMSPLGGFMIWPGGTSTLYYVKPDLSGYFRIVLAPLSVGAATAIAEKGGSVGWGMDLNGNFWMGDGSTSFLPKLYSSAFSGVPATLTLNYNPLFTLGATGGGCRLFGQAACTVWDG